MVADLATPPPHPPPRESLSSMKTGADSSPNAKSYRSARQSELDALRRKGLAKIFNRHFTATADAITREREAADLALNEINARKEELLKNPRSFENEDGISPTQLDQLAMELQRRKIDVQRKEKENEELMRRYVSQYGGSGDPNMTPNLKIPPNGTIRTPSSAIRTPNKGVSFNMPVVHEDGNEDVVKQTDLLMAKMMKEKSSKDGSIGKMRSGSTYQSPPITPRSHNFDTGKKSKLVAPKATMEDVEVSTDTSATVNETIVSSKEDESSSTESPSSSIRAGSEKSGDFGALILPRNMDDGDSVMSGLTSMDGETVAEAEWRLTEFLKMETDNIKKMFSNESDGESTYAGDSRTHVSCESSRAAEAASRAEELAKEMEKASNWMKDSSSTNQPKKKSSFAAWRSLWSEDHKRVYYHNPTSNQTCWTKPKNEEIDDSFLKKPTKDFSSANPDGDSTVVKDYTKEQQKNGMSDNLLMIDNYRPGGDCASVISGGSGLTSKMSKVSEYRRRRNRRRKRKVRRMAVVVAFATLTSFIYFARGRWMPIFGMKSSYQIAEEQERSRVENELIALRMKEEDNLRMREAEITKKLALEEQKRKLAEAAAAEAAARALKAETERKHLELNAAHAEQIIAAKRAEDENLKAQEAAKKAAIKQNKILEDLKKQQMKQAEESKILLEKLKKQQIKEAEETKKKKQIKEAEVVKKIQQIKEAEETKKLQQIKEAEETKKMQQIKEAEETKKNQEIKKMEDTKLIEDQRKNVHEKLNETRKKNAISIGHNNSNKPIFDVKKAKGCATPFSHLFSKKCRTLIKEDEHFFNIDTLVSCMLQ